MVVVFRKIYIIIFLISGFLLAQDYKSAIKFRHNPTDDSSWFLYNNNQGKYIIGAEIEYILNFKNPTIEYQINLSNAYKKNTGLSLGESFFKYNLSDQTFLRFGNYYRDYSNYLDDNLSSGHILISNNAMPIPKIGLVSSKEIKKDIYLKLGISHGWLKKGDYYTKTPLLHEKFLYLNIHKHNHKFGIGFVHEAMWGAAGPDYSKNDWEGYINFNHAVTLKNFFKVFISGDGPYQPPHANALGNHVGIWDFYYQKKSSDKMLKAYYQHIFEDTSGLRFANKSDGLWGLQLQNYIPKINILLEYLNTSNALINPPYQLDYYYYNYEYRLGWTYKNRSLGNPFINPGAGDPYINPVTTFKEVGVLNLALSGEFNSNYYLLKATRKINLHDYIKYKIVIGRKINKNFDLNIFIVDDKKIGFGLNYLI